MIKKCRKHKVTYLSHDSQNEFIDLLADETNNTIIEEVKKSDFFSLMADTTPDVLHQDQLSICLRYIDPFGEVCESLVAVCEAVEKAGLGIAENIKEIIQKNGLPCENIAFQSYDFDSSMSGKINRTTQKLSDLVGHIIYFIPCQTHRINTFLKHSCDASAVVVDLFSNLEQLYVFFFIEYKKIRPFTLQDNRDRKFFKFTEPFKNKVDC
ncbi:unnamed protein product [Macrosiphum euphorbiae]|uniref:DUF4371 domain-containing protein n=1 Tax=Macrosiphum euphorbiae TaxID=13131 RepID=A0AAV0WIF3_9HEMI|nr:unnamed protein product [Macrosiphum euphorbiae]